MPAKAVAIIGWVCFALDAEFMAAHGRNKEGDFTYHHCAVLQIRANAKKPIDTRFPAEK
jgi:hypothetical protein